jgi:hypothetical protein
MIATSTSPPSNAALTAGEYVAGSSASKATA